MLPHFGFLPIAALTYSLHSKKSVVVRCNMMRFNLDFPPFAVFRFGKLHFDGKIKNDFSCKSGRSSSVGSFLPTETEVLGCPPISPPSTSQYPLSFQALTDSLCRFQNSSPFFSRKSGLFLQNTGGGVPRKFQTRRINNFQTLSAENFRLPAKSFEIRSYRKSPP